MTVRTRILETAAGLLAQSADAEVSTRAICDAAGVTAPTLYHHFGDKDGLLAAVVDFGWAAFLETKRAVATVVHDHVADDVRAGWDNHLQFARENPSFYKLMWSPAVAASSGAVREAYQMLYDRLELGAGRGQLRMSAETAARIVLSATTGAALSLISQPDLYGDGTFATQLREAVIAWITVPQDAASAAHPPEHGAEPTIASAAATLSSRLAVEDTPLTGPEMALMQQWLTTLADAPSAALPAPPRRPQRSLGELAMITVLEPELSTYRWSSHDEADRFPVEDPATGEVITLVQGGGTAEVNAAVEAAHRAFQADWRWRTPAERAALLLKGADVLAEHADELALLESRENGKPVADARSNDVNFLIGVFRFFGSLVDKLPTDFYDKGAIYTSTYLEPVGVVGEIIPFNWPPIHADGKMAPALAAGNTVVLKPSEQAPLTVMRIVELLNTVRPEDVLHAVPGTGSKVGQPLAGHPLVRMVSFTGSTGAGAVVAGTAAKNITPALLELGGKDAMIVFDDADFDRAVKDAAEGGFCNKGEACTATSRILVQDGIYDRFVEQLAAPAS